MGTDFKFTDLLKLDKFITPMIMTVVYWILLAIAILSGIVVLANNGLLGLVTIILAPIYVRMLCEMIVLFFKIHSVLCEIRDQRKLG